MAEWTWELLAGPEAITEGPVWDGGALFYTSIARSEIRRYSPGSNTIATVYRNTNESNGLALGPDGALYACEGASGMVARYDRAGVKTIIASQFEGRRFNSPNDLVIDRAGRIWFTDPRYGEQAGRELDHDSVYRLTPAAAGAAAWDVERLTFDTTRPNGLLLSPDGRTLYVAQSDYSPESVRQLRAYPVEADGTLGQFSLLHDFGDARGIDGMRWDDDWEIMATCGWELSGPGSRITIFAANGSVLEEHPVPAGRPTNCAFGGIDLADLYVTTIEGHLYRVADTGRCGALKPPGKRPFSG